MKVLGSSRPTFFRRVFTSLLILIIIVREKSGSVTFHSIRQLSEKLLCYLSTKAAVYSASTGQVLLL